MIDSNQMLEKIKSYDKSINEDLFYKAIDLLVQYHRGHTRESGEPYYYHALEVANIIVDMKLDYDSIIAALLSNILEDTPITIVELKEYFGENIANLVDGITKLTKLTKLFFTLQHIKQVENLRKMLLAVSEDLRVLLIKLADRLHNMRTTKFITSIAKKRRIVTEILEIFAPLTERMGLQQLKSEMQDIAFEVLHPEIRHFIINKFISPHCSSETISSVTKELIYLIKKHNISAEVCGREKTPYSIWQKITNKKTSVDQLHDIIAFRIITDTLGNCYQILGILHEMYPSISENFHDFISNPKKNGYQSIHTILIRPGGYKIEVQIRTKEMHEVAEFGMAAHWRYKQNYTNKDGFYYNAMRELLESLKNSKNVTEFLNHTKLELYRNDVFCFTPKGDIKQFPKEITVLDFAYTIHSDIGNRCVGAKINGHFMSISTILKNTDCVEIITSEYQNPSSSWEKIAVTKKAKSLIRKYLKTANKDQYILIGRNLFTQALHNLQLKDYQVDLNKVVCHFNKEDVSNLYLAIGRNEITKQEILYFLLKYHKFSDPEQKSKKLENRIDSIQIKGMEDGIYIYAARCCYPVPGDSIIGIIHTGKGVAVHTDDCSIVSKFTSTPEKILKLSWNEKQGIKYLCRFSLILHNEASSITSIVDEVLKCKISINQLKIINQTNDYIELLLDIEMININELQNIVSIIKSNNLVISVQRHDLRNRH